MGGPKAEFGGGKNTPAAKTSTQLQSEIDTLEQQIKETEARIAAAQSGG